MLQGPMQARTGGDVGMRLRPFGVSGSTSPSHRRRPRRKKRDQAYGATPRAKGSANPVAGMRNPFRLR